MIKTNEELIKNIETSTKRISENFLKSEIRIKNDFNNLFEIIKKRQKILNGDYYHKKMKKLKN